MFFFINSQNGGQLPSLSGLDRDDGDQDETKTGVITGYGYTRGSQEFAGRRKSGGRPARLLGRGQAGEEGKLVESWGRSAQTVRPRMR